VHIFAWPYKQLSLDGFAGRVEYAQLLNDASEVFLREPTAQQMEMGGAAAGAVTLDLPVERPPVAIPVVELFLKGNR
jgi:alpha-L-fucosidase